MLHRRRITEALRDGSGDMRTSLMMCQFRKGGRGPLFSGPLLEDNTSSSSDSGWPMYRRLFVLFCIAMTMFPISLAAQQIRGDYIETRSADIYTGQCFANGEVNLVGNQAILAWHVREGGWDGVPLDGLTVAAAVRAHGTLGDPYENPYPAQAVLIVDDQANEQQRAALVAFAQQMGGELLRHVNSVISATTELA